MFAALAMGFIIVNSCTSFNIDIVYPLLIKGKSSRSSFGFSVAFFNSSHYGMGQTNGDIGILVGAPTDDDDSVANTRQPGRVYSCPIISDLNNQAQYPCQSLSVDRNQTDWPPVTSPTTHRDYSLLGFTVVAQTRKPWKAMVCAPHWTSSFNPHVPNAAAGKRPLPLYPYYRYRPRGMCYNFRPVSANTSANYDEIGNFVKGSALEKFAFAFTEAGFSVHLPEHGNVNALIGAPGYHEGLGTIFHTLSFQQPVQYMYNDRLSSSFCHDEGRCSLGYSVSSGRIFGNGSTWLLAGMPNAKSSGMVVIYQSSGPADVADTRNLEGNLLQQRMSKTLFLKGDRYGESFGASLLVVDLNNDGRDDVVAGAPNANCSGPDTDEGAVYVFLSNATWNDRPGKIIAYNILISGSDGPGARFGISLARLGDLNGDGYQDFMVGSPFGASGGAIHIFFGGPEGLKQNLNTKILSPVNNTGFGWALSGGTDIDGNFVNDIAVGDFKTGSVHIFRSRPVVVWTVYFKKSSSVIFLQQTASQLFFLTPCLRVSVSTGRLGNNPLDIRIKITLDSELAKSTSQTLRALFNSTDNLQSPNVKTLPTKLHKPGDLCFSEPILVGNFTSWSYELIKSPFSVTVFVEDTMQQQYLQQNSFCPNCPILSPESLSTDTTRFYFSDCESEQNCMPTAELQINGSSKSSAIIELFYQVNTTVVLHFVIANTNATYRMYSPALKLELPSPVMVERISGFENGFPKLLFDVNEETDRNVSVVTCNLPVGVNQILQPGSSVTVSVVLDLSLIKIAQNVTLMRTLPIKAFLGQTRLGLLFSELLWTENAKITLEFRKAFSLRATPSRARTTPEVRPYVQNNMIINPSELTFNMSIEITNDGPEDAPNSTHVTIELPIGVQGFVFLKVMSVVVSEPQLTCVEAFERSSLQGNNITPSNTSSSSFSAIFENAGKLIGQRVTGKLELSCMETSTPCAVASCFLPPIRKGQIYTITATLKVKNDPLRFVTEPQALLEISVNTLARIQESGYRNNSEANLIDISVPSHLSAQVTTTVKIFFENYSFPLSLVIGAVCGSILFLLLLIVILVKFGFFGRQKIDPDKNTNPEECHEVVDLLAAGDDDPNSRTEPIASSLPGELQRFQSSSTCSLVDQKKN